MSTQVTARIEKDGTYALFFYLQGQLTCYTLREGHCQATIGHLQRCTGPAWHGPAGWGAEALKLWHRWCGIGEQAPCHLVRRLDHRKG